MSISTSGLAALLVVATFALTSCGGDDGGATATTSAAPASGTVQTTTTTQASAPSATTTTKQAPATTAQPTTTQKTQTTAKTQTSKTTAAAPSTTSGDGGGCGPIEIGVRDGDIELTYARITGQRGVNCATVTIVAQQWGGQQIGIDRALLPKGWSCTSGNTCSGDKGGFSFVLYKPQS
jgi:hypothetical protein